AAATCSGSGSGWWSPCSGCGADAASTGAGGGGSMATGGGGASSIVSSTSGAASSSTTSDSAEGSGTGATGFTVFTSRGGGSAGATGLAGSAGFFAEAPFLPLAIGVSAKMSPDGSAILRWRASRSTNCRATTSSIVLDALLTSIPWSRFSSAVTSWLVVPSSSATL